MKNVRMVTAMMILALLLALVPATMAQDMGFGLSADDMAELTSASAATAAATSGQFTFTANMAFSSDEEAGTVDLTGTGTWETGDGGDVELQLLINGEIDAEGQTTPINAEVRVVNETLYIGNVSMGAEAAMPGWFSISAAEIEMYGSMYGSMLAEQLPVDAGAIAGDVGQLNDAGMGGMNQIMGMFGDVDPTEFINMSRNADQFTTTVDLIGLLSTPAFQDYVLEQIQNSDDNTMSEAEVSELMSNLPTAFQGSQISLDQYVTDGMLSRVTLTLAMNVDPEAIGEEGEAGSFALTFDINLSGFNQDYTVEEPTGAQPLLGSMGGS